MDSQGEIFRLCRLCLVKDQVDIPIFDDPGDERQILLKISSCLPVTVSQDDDLPKKICDVCSEKLDSFYEFWNSTASAEKTLRDRLTQEVRQSEPMVPKPIKTLIKEESEVLDEAHAEPVVEEESTKDETEAPPRKRPRRVSAIKAQVSIAAQESDDEEFDTAELVTKVEDGSDEMDIEEKVPNLLELPGTSTDIDQDQAGPSGLGKDGAEAPFKDSDVFPEELSDDLMEMLMDLVSNGKPTSQTVSDEAVNLKFSWESEESSELAQVFNEIMSEEPTETQNTCVTCKLQQDSCSCEQLCEQLENESSKLADVKDYDMKSVEQLSFKCKKCPAEFGDQQHLDNHQSICRQMLTIQDIGNWTRQIAIQGPGEIQLNLIESTEESASMFQMWEDSFSNFSVSEMPVDRVQEKIVTPEVDDEHLELQMASQSIQNKKLKSVKSQNKKKIAERKPQEMIHPGDEGCTCSFCKYTLMSQCEAASISEKKPYNCKYCVKSFPRPSGLKSHLRIHTGEKPYCCKECGKCFSRKGSLDMHVVIHTNERPFSCQYCGKCFSRKCSLTAHVKIHTGEKPPPIEYTRYPEILLYM